MSHSYFRSLIVPLSLCCVCFLVSGCSGPRPVLYPNDHLKRVGPEQAELDIEECQQLAEDYVPEHEAASVAGNTAVGAGAGGAVGAVSGAIRGGAGIGAAIGAATGATVGFIRGLFQASQPTPAQQAFVNRCLAERGYDSIGWD
ncbi:MAG TPA: glycine zipper family protein [Nitrospirales bacterium]|nr:glycine zipper family protein [Nitrospirales bacterium]